MGACCSVEDRNNELDTKFQKNRKNQGAGQANQNNYDFSNFPQSDNILDYTSEEIRNKIQELGQFKPKNIKSDGTLSPLFLDDTEFRNIQILDSGEVYEGDWDKKLNVKSGYGTLVWKNGSIYQGQFKNDKANGKGRIIHENLDVYEGDFKFGKANGKGVYESSDSKYTGEVQEDKRHGKGEEEWDDGTTYSGEYLDGQKYGNGTLTWPDGNCYKGQFRDNKIEGKGRLEYKDEQVYDGQWKEGK